MIGKRIFDLVFSGIGLFFLAPIFVIVGIWIKVDSPGPVFFRQIRVGCLGETFRIYKFRTMVTDAERMGRQITVGQDSRITKVGRFLRKYKIDEFPQLINVLKGEMSLVGPRPEVPRYVALYPAPLKEIVLSVPPGITDFGSIAFKDENDLLSASNDPETTYIQEIMPKKLAYNVKYVEERSLIVDCSLIFKTLSEIFIKS